MKKKDLKILAKKIAEAEYIIQTSSDASEVAKAQDTIFELSRKAMSFDDMIAIDEMVQEILSQKI